MRRLVLILSFLTVPLIASDPAFANWIGNIHLQYDSPAHLAYGTRVELSFDYAVTEAEGMRVQAYPWSLENDFPSFTWSGCPVLTGTGSQTVWFILGSGAVDISYVRLRAWNADTSAALLDLDLPVEYHYSDHAVYDLQMSFLQPSWPPLGEPLLIDFVGHTTLTEGAYVFMRPYTDDQPTPGYAASQASVIPTGFAAGTQWFTFDADADVNAVRVWMTDPTQSVTLLEFFVPVEYHWRAHGFTDLELVPAPPAYLPFGVHVIAEFDYHTSHMGDVAVWARGAWDGAALNPQFYEGSLPLGSPTGHLTRWFTVPEGALAEMNSVMLQMNVWSANMLCREFCPTQYTFSDHGVYNVEFHPSSTAILDHDANVDITFDYGTNWPENVLIFAEPRSHGYPVPHYMASGSPYYPSGSGSGTHWFRVLDDDLLVDQVRFTMTNADQTAYLLEFSVDTSFFYGDLFHATGTPEIPPRKAILEQNAPNPFNPVTTIAIDLPHAGEVALEVFDLRGRSVVDLWKGMAPAGRTEIRWDGRDADGRPMPSGIYCYRLEYDGNRESRRMVLLR